MAVVASRAIFINGRGHHVAWGLVNMAAVTPNPVEPARQASGRLEKLRLGDVLVQQLLISQEQLQQTLELRRQTSKKTGPRMNKNPAALFVVLSANPSLSFRPDTSVFGY